MTVDFEQPSPKLGKLHPVYATYWMTKHVELVSRKIILPFLEKDEEGIGFEVNLKHLASALPGMEVIHTARFSHMEKNRIYAQVEVHNQLGDKIGQGMTTQVILSKEKLQKSFADLYTRWDDALGQQLQYQEDASG
ncbi:MAG: thioesterase family protein [Deinococcales bacterium]